MQPNVAVHILNSADSMPMWSVHAANPNDIMCGVCDMHAQASQASVYATIYLLAWHECVPTVDY